MFQTRLEKLLYSYIVSMRQTVWKQFEIVHQSSEGSLKNPEEAD